LSKSEVKVEVQHVERLAHKLFQIAEELVELAEADIITQDQASFTLRHSQARLAPAGDFQISAASAKIATD
jgi:hypothetical protein